jgi:hypothetical protein
MIRNLEHLKSAKDLYPNAWKQADIFRLGRGVDLPKWPAWCFVPMAGWYAIACEGRPVLPLERAGDVGRLAALGTWRISQGIYKFDPELQAALCETVLQGEIPSEVLLRLPEWCIFIETPGLTFQSDNLHGFYVHLESDVNDGRKELRFLLDTDQKLLPMPMHIGPWTVTEALDRVVSESAKQAGVVGMPAPSADLKMGIAQSIAESLQPILALVLYICSDEPDIVDRDQPEQLPQRPQPKKTKHGWKLFPPKKPRIWNVGDQLGEQIRRAPSNDDGSDRNSPRPHLRRAHWHGYWHGPRDGERKFKYRWLPPMVVAGEK